MAKEAYILWVHGDQSDHGRGNKVSYGTKSQDKVLTDLLNQGWVIVAAGGGAAIAYGFIVLQRDTP